MKLLAARNNRTLREHNRITDNVNFNVNLYSALSHGVSNALRRN